LQSSIRSETRMAMLLLLMMMMVMMMMMGIVMSEVMMIG
jgi:hypothetical protein